jgi:ectoine hydroxylase-related dioxygenase (phytanoyl-CoA dioxygenase family)
MPQVFTSSFSAMSAEEIAAAIREKGYFSTSDGLHSDHVSQLRHELANRAIGFNANDVGPVVAHDADRSQLYFTHALAASKAFVDLVTHPRVLDVAEKTLDKGFRLKCQRYYETYEVSRVGWHTDHNNNDAEYTNIPGLIYIVYMVDVLEPTQGPFQLIAGSNRWTRDKRTSGYDDTYINEHHSEDIVTFLGRAGTLIIYDSAMVHRGKPIEERRFTRKSIFLQVDAHPYNGEKILVNTSYLNAFDERIAKYLGFGQPAAYDTFPRTSISTLTPKGLLALQKQVAASMARQSARHIFTKVVPARAQPFLRRGLHRFAFPRTVR